MPYIMKTRRPMAAVCPQDAGELNYAITTLIKDYLARCGGANYGAYNGVVGVLECAKLELYRRMVASYEDQKIKENGDVYPASPKEDKPEYVHNHDYDYGGP